MTTLSVMGTLWILLVATFVALMVYRGHLTQHETDQLFLTETEMSSGHRENDEIVRRVNRIQPICQGVGGVAVLMTLAIVGVWIYQILPH